MTSNSGELTFVADDGIRQGKHKLFRYRCKCGKEKQIRQDRVRSGTVKTCGCCHLDHIIDGRGGKPGRPATKQTHGESGGLRSKRTAEYKTFRHMIVRCENPKNNRYKYYGGRGIKVCDRWRRSYETFLADMGRKPSPEYSIDRIDVNGDYEPSNCRWATKSEQSKNRRFGLGATP